MGRLDGIYARLPLAAQHAAVSAFGVYWHWVRNGPGYARAVRGYVERERFTAAQWKAWQEERLRVLLSETAERVPFYREAWGRDGRRAAGAGRLADLPPVGKQPLREDPLAFTREDMRPRPRLVLHTSGSTGTPVRTMWSVREYRDSRAVREARSARWAGTSFELPRATFSGRMVEPDARSRGPFYRLNLAERQVYLSAFHLRPATARAYVEALRRHGVQWLTGYAVSYYLLAEHILEQGLEPPPLRAVVTTSEKVTAPMRRVMEEAYRCRVFEEYGTVENALFASECEHGRLHLSPDVGVVEVLRPDGTPCDPGEPGEVVATSLSRRYQPLVRFRLGDMATLSPEGCPCGREMPVLLEVVGRTEDVVVGPDGRRMVRFHGIFVDQPHVREGQIVQETLRRIRVRVVPADGYGPADADEIVRRVRARLGDEVEVVAEVVESIPRTRAGKFRAVVSLVGQAGGAVEPVETP